MHLHCRLTIFLALVGVLIVTGGAQRTSVGDDGSGNNASTGNESKTQVMKSEAYYVFRNWKHFLTNDLPQFFKNHIPNISSVKGSVTKEVKVIKDEIENVENTIETEITLIKFQDACECVDYNCGCCQHLEEPTIHLNSTICANVTYLSEDIGISLTVTVNDYAIFNETVSVRNPPPVCLGVPYVKEWAEACVRFHDIDATRTHLHACAEVEARMKHVLIAKYELGCFDIGPIKNAKSNVEQRFQQPSVMLV